ncbi:MAG: hypothetical protein HC779_04860 [Phyllobacteriaceae bacterium]|nr:hypothetical protein [Phyllobacteriaceae bacterium]
MIRRGRYCSRCWSISGFAAILPALSLRVLLGLVFAGLAGLAAVMLAHGSADVGFAWDNFAGGVPRVTFGFFVGVLLYRVFDAAKAAPRGGSMAAWGVMAVMVACFAMPCPPQWRWLMELVMIALVFPGLVLAAAGMAPGQHSVKLFSLLGAASYGIMCSICLRHGRSRPCLKGW